MDAKFFSTAYKYLRTTLDGTLHLIENFQRMYKNASTKLRSKAANESVQDNSFKEECFRWESEVL